MRAESRIASAWAKLVLIARTCCGLPDYEAWVAHCRAHHPERPLPSRAEFHREREAARYARGRSRCC
jgi:uncharacterized short protein YbdD (DUF466 family)